MSQTRLLLLLTSAASAMALLVLLVALLFLCNKKPLLSQSSQNSAQQVLSKLQPEWLCPICALINPGAAANAASRLGLSGTFSAHATSQVYTSFQDTTLLRKLLSKKFCFKDNMTKGTYVEN